MRGLRQQIDSAVDHKRAVAWIKTCIVIHTLVFDIENGAEDPEFVEELIRDGSEVVMGGGGNEVAEESARETRGQRMRTFLKESLFESLDRGMST